MNSILEKMWKKITVLKNKNKINDTLENVSNTVNDTIKSNLENSSFTDIQLENWNVLQVCTKNFKIDSSNWEKSEILSGFITGQSDQPKNISVKISPEWDIWEILDYPWKWEQLFTWDGAKRELEKKWYRLPTNDELKEINDKTSSIFDTPKTTPWSISNNRAHGRWEYLNIWTSAEENSEDAKRMLKRGKGEWENEVSEKKSWLSVYYIKKTT